MNHQEFEEVLFSIEEPNSEAAQALQEHLKGCEACRQLYTAKQAVDARLRSAPIAAAKPGFADRWQMRLAEHQTRLHRRQTLAVLGFVIGTSTLLVGSLAVLALPLIQSPTILLLTFTYRILELVWSVEAAQNTLFTLLRTAAGAIPLWVWVIFTGVLTQLAVMWVVSYRLLTRPRSVTK